MHEGRMGVERPQAGIRRAVVCAIAFTVAASGHSAHAAQVINDPALKLQVNSKLLLASSELTSIDFDRTPGVVQEIVVPLLGEDVVLEVWPHSVRSDIYEVIEQRADGSYATVTPSPVRTIRGTVKDLGGMVVGSIDDSGVTAMISLAADEEYWIEPLAGRFDGATAGMHVVYAAADAIPGGGTCAMDVDRAREMFGEGDPLAAGPMPGCDGLPCIAELACDADFEYFQAWGTTTAVEARINAIMNAVNHQYEIEVGITHVITAIVIRTSEPDPYNGNVGEELLMQLRNQWLQNHQDIVRDLVQLFTGRTLAPPPIGIALTIGGICTTNAFCLVTNGEQTFTCVTDLTAHELGHLWGASHCTCAGFTMNPSITCANRFGPQTSPSIVAHRESRLCLTSRAPATALPFADTFTGPGVNAARWYNTTAVVDDFGNGEPSPPNSLRIRGTLDRVTSGYMDATSLERAGLEYWWQRTGTTGASGSPEPGEDLVLEYKNNDGLWVEARRHLGDGPDNSPYARACAIMPDDMDLTIAQFRFRMVGGQSNDNFFVDDVRLTAGTDFLSIQSQPEFGCACLGGSTQFSVTAAGEGTIMYQWRRNGVDIPGATGSTLMLNNIVPSDFTNYSVVVTNACGSVISDNADLFESTDPGFIGQPPDTEIEPGGTLALFTSTTGGCGEFQWFVNDVAIDGATSSFLFIPDMQCANQGCYHVVMTNDCGVAESDVAEVTVTGCEPLQCDVDNVAPVVVHATGQAGQTRPFSGFIDPRRESTNGVNLNQGITQIDIRFSEPVEKVGGGPLDATSFAVTQTGGAPPTVTGVNVVDMPLVHVTLSRPLTLRQWTTVRAIVQDTADTPNIMVNVGNMGPGVNESDRVDIGFLPGDVTQTSGVNPLDLLKYKQYVNNIELPPIGALVDYLDTNRSGGVNPLDLLAYKQLINGVNPPATQAWSGTTMSSPRP